MVREIIGNGILAQEGSEHRAHRKMLTAPFSLTNIRKLEPVFKEKARGISAVFDDAISAGDDGGKTGVIDCTETFSKATLDIMGVTILGKELSNLSTVKYRGKVGGAKPLEDEFTFHRAYDLFFAPGPVGKLLTYFNGFFPLRWLPLQENRDFLFAMKWLNGVLTRLSRERIQEVKQAMAIGTYESQDSRDLTTFIVEESMPGGSAEGIQEREFVGHVSSLVPLRGLLIFANEGPSFSNSWPLAMIPPLTSFLGLCISWPRTTIFKTSSVPRS